MLKGKLRLAYLGGLFDGEGCIGIYTRRIKGRPGYILRISVAMTSQYALKLFQFLFGGSVTPLKPQSPKHSPQWVWVISAKKARDFLIALLPYLVIKKPEAELGIEFQGGMVYTGGKKVSDGEKAVREAQRILMSSMKGLSGKQGRG